jgi:hypothetical protein
MLADMVDHSWSRQNAGGSVIPTSPGTRRDYDGIINQSLTLVTEQQTRLVDTSPSASPTYANTPHGIAVRKFIQFPDIQTDGWDGGIPTSSLRPDFSINFSNQFPLSPGFRSRVNAPVSRFFTQLGCARSTLHT